MTEYLSGIWRLRYFWMALVRNDLRSRYRGSILGIGWSMLHPIAMTAVLCVIFGPMMGQPLRDFAPYILTGLTFWNFAMAAVTQGCHCFFQGETYIRQYPAPLAIHPLRTILGAGYHFALGLVLALAFTWCFKGPGNLSVLLTLVPTLILLFVVGWSLTVCAGVANVMFQDFQHLIAVGMQVLFYMTPIFWMPEQLCVQRPYLVWLVQMNPFAMLLELVRQPLLYGQLPSTWAVGMSAATALAAVTAASLALLKFEKRMIFYL